MRRNKIVTMPALPMRGLVIFPKMILHFDVGREKSIRALKAAIAKDHRIFLVTQKDSQVVHPDKGDIFSVGVIAEVRQILKTPDGATRVLVEGIQRARVSAFNQDEPYLELDILPLQHDDSESIEETLCTALRRMLLDAFRGYCALTPKMPQELFDSILSEQNLDNLFDLIVFNVYLKPEDKQRLLEIDGLQNRIETLIGVMESEVSVLELEASIHEQVREAVEKNQREYYIREQMRVLAKQLGTNDDPTEESREYIDRIEAAGFDKQSREKLIKEAEKLTKLAPNSQEVGVIRTYLDNVLAMPWNKYTKDKNDADRAQRQLDKDHYGLTKVKERITELIAVRMLKPDIKGQIICLVGPPGTGKTSVGKSVAKALGRNFVRISLGGVRDEAEIRGHRKTYIGAMPGRIANAVKQAGSMNPLILLDEIDKMGADYKGDPASAMLEVLDPEQNVSFVDHYLEVPTDLSEVLFITTANTLDTIPAPLLDRMEVIELGSYTREEKFNIAKRHLIPKQLERHGLKPVDSRTAMIKIADSAVYSLIDFYTREAGVRRLEQRIAALCRKAAKRLISTVSHFDGKQAAKDAPLDSEKAEKADKTGKTANKKLTITSANIGEFLGVKKFQPETVGKMDEVGVVNGLAWTSVGGVLLPIEVVAMEGSGKIEITGSLGDVMSESAKIAVSLVRTLAVKYGFDPEFYKNRDLHIHAPEGAVPKNGPSAGVTMTTALISALSGIAVKHDIAMTGEITLHGKVMPIGGLREKTMAAYKSGIKTVVIPKENEPDLEEIDSVVRANLRFVIAENIKTVLDAALVTTDIKPFVRKAENPPMLADKTAATGAQAN